MGREGSTWAGHKMEGCYIFISLYHVYIYLLFYIYINIFLYVLYVDAEEGVAIVGVGGQVRSTWTGLDLPVACFVQNTWDFNTEY